MGYTLNEAAKATGKSKTTIHRALKSGKISAEKMHNGTYSIEPAELHRAFPSVPKHRDEEHDTRNDTERQSNTSRALHTQLETIEKERQRERDQLQETIADLREDRDRWRQQATALLEDHRRLKDEQLKGFWQKLFR